MQQNKNITKHIAKIINTGIHPPSTKNAINAFTADVIALMVADVNFTPALTIDSQIKYSNYSQIKSSRKLA